jgi:hypothetical protein
MSDAPEQIWTHSGTFRLWRDTKEGSEALSGGTPTVAYVRKDTHKAEIERLRAATNQCRLAFAGLVSVSSAVDMLDALGEKAKSDE